MLEPKKCEGCKHDVISTNAATMGPHRLGPVLRLVTGDGYSWLQQGMKKVAIGELFSATNDDKAVSVDGWGVGGR